MCVCVRAHRACMHYAVSYLRRNERMRQCGRATRADLTFHLRPQDLTAFLLLCRQGGVVAEAWHYSRHRICLNNTPYTV